MTNEERQALIKDTKETIDVLETYIARLKGHTTDLSRFESQIKRQKIALAALQAKPACYAHRLINTLSGTVYPWAYGLDERKPDECSGFTVEVKPLYSVSPAPAVPDGWRLVPVEPTDEMLAAAMECDDVVFDKEDDTAFCVQFDNIYSAMLEAAPEPEGDA